MPVNKSRNKVKVVKHFGMGNSIGLCDPQVNMLTDQGKILSLDSGNYTVIVGRGSGNYKQRYNPEYLLVLDTVASSGVGSVAWPTGVGCVRFGHTHGMLAGGEPILSASGVSFFSGDGTVHTYGRA